ncbi:hypothetical protein [Chromobacterium vaccinii]|uniref:hypothetical protein n=1 Tax=Chromobacterium vaccinii TaxID=1108595 RepID=UPI000695E9DA|nr:hypothetical protein [Chromobacterium vaccinii]QND85145.1 Uncharacterized protein ChrSW_2919 [Chromobacterium vaccinii]QND90376.1 Uncharacterized protein ChrSV_2919 [Chromobacterium vaccinii]
MHTPTTSVRYRIYGASPARECSLLIDYVPASSDLDKIALLRHIQLAADEPLRSWPARDALQTDDLFEIECVSGQQAALRAVEFWRAYFRALGEPVIESGHLPPMDAVREPA